VDETELQTRILAVREAVADATRVAGRDPNSVSILPVTKGFPAGVLESVASAGFRVVGENRVDEAATKRDVLEGLQISVHMIGHLQRNKAAAAVRLFDRIDSVDSIRLAGRLDSLVGASGDDPLAILVQVNASGEASKGGFPIGEAPEAIARIAVLPHIVIRGLMTMAPFGAEEPALHGVFARTRECLESCRAQIPGFDAVELSMGMSGDFAIAIAEGSTQVRLGTALLGERQRWT
jgi:pyridoxal phosphate enzyme (YggS family)